MVARNFSNTAVETTLQSGISDSDTSLTVVAATGYPSAPFTILIESEIILVGVKTGTTFSTLTRGFGGSTAVSHSGGATVQHVAVAGDLSLVTTHVHVPGTDDTPQLDHGALAGLDPDDDHTQYHTDGRADTWLATKDTDDLTEGVTNEYFKTHDHTAAGEGGDLDPITATQVAADIDTDIATHTADWDAHAADPVVAIGGDDESVVDVSLSTTYEDGASVTFIKPASWNTYDIEAWGMAVVFGVPTCSLGVKIDIGGTSGGVDQFSVAASDRHYPSARHNRTGLTANVTAKIQYRRASGSGGSKQRSQISFIAVRTS